jgi:hypothetical protein
VLANTGGTNAFNNSGTVSKTAGTGTAAINAGVPLTNLATGTISVGSGTLQATGFATNAGQIVIASGASFATAGTALVNAATGVISDVGNLDLGGSLLTNNGTLLINGTTLNTPTDNRGIVNIAGNSTLAGASFTMTSGAVNVGAGATLTRTGGVLDWVGGTLAGSGAVVTGVGGSIGFSGAGARILNGPTLALPAMTLGGGSLDVLAGAINVAGASVVNGAALRLAGGSFNTDTLTLQAGSMQGAGGSFDIASGLALPGGGSVGGVFGNAGIRQATGNLQLDNLAASGLVTISVPAGNLSIGGGASPAVITGSNVSLSARAITVGGSAATAPASVAATGTLDLVTTGGDLTVLGGTGAGASAALVSGGNMTVNVSGGTLVMNGGAGSGAYAQLRSAGDIALPLGMVPSLNANAAGQGADAVLAVSFGRNITIGGVAQKLVAGDPLANATTDAGYFELPATAVPAGPNVLLAAQLAADFNLGGGILSRVDVGDSLTGSNGLSATQQVIEVLAKPLPKGKAESVIDAETGACQ